MRYLILVLLGFFLWSCDDEIVNEIPVSPEIYKPILKVLTEKDYPENPDWPLMHPDWRNCPLTKLQIQKDTNGVTFSLSGDQKDSISIPSIDITEFIPYIPDSLRNNEYLSLLSIVNQEWNRQQVKFDSTQFYSNISSVRVTRVDLARNCLNSYLWEIIIYADQNGADKPYFHGWFDFPHSWYQQLVEERNGVSFSKYANYLESWKDPKSQVINLNSLRKELSHQQLSFLDFSTTNYFLKGERAKKYRNVVYPKSSTVIRSYQTDSTLFSTFSPPGYYTTETPRKTELSRFYKLLDVSQKFVTGYGVNQDTVIELKLSFLNPDLVETSWVISGLNLLEIPVLPDSLSYLGWQNSMGFSNHTFYSTYKYTISHPAKKSSYFSFLHDNNGKWLDSHAIGIDGPLLYFDTEGYLHLLVLSFERHSIVGHYRIELQK